MSHRTIAFVLMLAALAGCASTYTLTVTAAPDGAMLAFQNGTAIGQAPITLTYNADPTYMSGNCFRVMGVTATWTSGAQAHSDSILPICGGNAAHRMVHLNRPANAPGMGVDLRVAEMRLAERLSGEERKLRREQMLLPHQMEAAKEIGEAIGTILAQ